MKLRADLAVKRLAGAQNHDFVRRDLDGDLFFLELTTRSSVEDEALVLRELEARIDPEAAEATRMRTSIATRYLIRGDAQRAIDILGSGPPSGSRDAVER